jgi:hypothetical protein
MSAEKPDFDINASLLKHVALLKPWFPKYAVVSIGEYSSQILLKGSLLDKSDKILSLFVEKSRENDPKWSQFGLEAYNILGIDPRIDSHFWFNILPYITKNEAVIEKLRNKPIDKLDGAIIIASIGEGLGSALLPELTSRFHEWNINSVGFAVWPSKVQPPDAYFNSLWSIAMCVAKGFAPILISRDSLEGYIGVDRKGFVITGDMVLNYVLELALAKESFVQELCELARSLRVKMFTILSATGASLKVHGSLKNILDTALLRPFLLFDLSSASVLYALVRMPLKLRDELPRGKIELALDSWFKERASLKSVYVSEPMYADDGSDRMDIVMFVGGFDLTEIVTSTDRKVKDITNYAIKNGFTNEKEWQELVKSLME